MTLDISQALRAPGEQIPFLHRDEIPPQEIFSEQITFDEVTLEGHFTMLGTVLHLQGVLHTVAHAHCSACLKPVDYPVDVQVDEVFNRVEDHRYQAEETDEWDEEQLSFEGSKVELGHLVLTLTLLELPIRFLCEEGCAARPQENDENYACQKDPDQNPFSALQQLLEKEQED